MQELGRKRGGGRIFEGGVLAGHYGIIICKMVLGLNAPGQPSKFQHGEFGPIHRQFESWNGILSISMSMAGRGVVVSTVLVCACN